MKPPPALSVVVGERLFYLAERQPVRDQLAGIELHLVFARRPAKNVDVHNVGHGLQLVQHKPVLSVFSSITSYFGFVLILSV
jgi:hypothetical protein